MCWFPHTRYVTSSHISGVGKFDYNKSMRYQPTIGLEIHAELKTAAKMFCQCANNPLAKRPNFDVCPICLGHPGALPAGINQQAVEQTIKLCLALNCQICDAPQFYRKNYFYPDLPKGYQITSQKSPFGEGGYLNIIDSRLRGNDNKRLEITSRGGNDNDDVAAIQDCRVRIHHIHLEEDTARLAHPVGADYSLVDFNRSGVPLLELVSEPDIHCASQAREFCQKLQLILRYLGVSDADMEKGQMRCEVNISLMQNAECKMQNGGKATKALLKLGTKVEIKNLNSFRSVEKAIEFEIKRQADCLDRGEKIIQETRGWHDAKQITFSQRSKEEAYDYRYFPEPDLPPLDMTDKKYFNIETLKNHLPELPDQRLARLQAEYGLPAKQAEVFVNNKELGDYFEQVVSELKEWMGMAVIASEGAKPEVWQSQDILVVIKLAANYLITELQKLLLINKKVLAEIKITPENFAEFIVLTYKQKVSSSGAQTLLAEMFATGADPSNIIESKGLAQVSDQSFLETVALEVIKNNPQSIKDWQAGKQNVLQFLVGQVMRQTKGQANPQIAQEILKQKLDL